MRGIYLVFIIGLFGLLLASCGKEKLTIGDAIALGELDKTNYVQIKKGVKLLDDPDIHMEVDSVMVILKGSMSDYDSIHVGDVICKFKYTENEPYTYHRRVLDMYEVGGNTMLVTEPVGIPDIFTRINIDSRNKGDDVVMFRTDLFSYGLIFKPASPYLLQELKGSIDPDINLNFSYDTTASVYHFQYDSIAGIIPQIVLELKDIKYEGTFKICASAQIAGGYKNDKIIPEPVIPITGIPIPPLNAIGFGFYINPKFEALVKLKGEICSNKLNFTGGPFSYSATINLIAPIVVPLISGSTAPTLGTLDANTWSVAGSGSIEAFGGADLYISNLGAKDVQLLKAGISVGSYMRANLTPLGTPENLYPEFELEADYGKKFKVFLTAELFGGNATSFIGNMIKGKVFFETSDFRLQLYKFNPIVLSVNCEREITSFNVNPTNTNMSIRVNCSNCNGNKFYVVFNDSTLSMPNGIEIEYDYNTDYNITPPTEYQVSNVVLVQDVNSLACTFKEKFTDPEFGLGDCTEFRDERDQELYCLTTIGTQTWMADNLKYDGAGGVWYEMEENHFNRYCGKLYTYEEIQVAEAAGGICPVGFRLPTEQDFITLVENSGGVAAGKNLKHPSPAFWDGSLQPSFSNGNFNAVGAGIFYPWKLANLALIDAFGQQLDATYYWTSSTETINNEIFPKAFEIRKDWGLPEVLIERNSYIARVIKNLGVSCRCIQN